MRELMREIFAVEEEGRRLVAAARLRADGILAEARKKAAELSAASLAAARAEAARVLAEAREAAGREKAALLRAEEEKAALELRLDDESRRHAAALVAARVAGKKLDGGADAHIKRPR